MLSSGETWRTAMVAVLSVLTWMVGTTHVSALDLRTPDLRGSDLGADVPATASEDRLPSEAEAMAADLTAEELADALERAASHAALPTINATDSVAIPAGLFADLRPRQEAEDSAPPEPDLSALTNAIPETDARPRIMDENFTLSGPRRAGATDRNLPRPTTSLTVLGRDLTGRRNPRSSTQVLLGR